MTGFICYYGEWLSRGDEQSELNVIERLRVLILSRYPVSSGSSVSFLCILRLVEVGIPEVISFGLRVADES